MDGSTLFLIEESAKFRRSFKKLVKSFKSLSQQQEFITVIGNYIEDLISNPYPPQARPEPLPRGYKLPEDYQLFKLSITIAKGASGQTRIMYLVSEEKRIIVILWIFTHEQFQKRPPDKDLKDILQEIFEEE